MCGEFYSAGSNLNLVASTFSFLNFVLSKRAHVAREDLLHWLRKLHGFGYFVWVFVSTGTFKTRDFLLLFLCFV